MTDVYFIGIARIPDKCPIAEYALLDSESQPRTRFSGKFTKLMNSSRIVEHRRLTITDKDVGHIHYESDPVLLFMVVTSPTYSQNVAFRLLSEVRETMEREFATEMSNIKAYGLSKAAKPSLKDLVTKYQDAAKVDKISNVMLQVEQVKGAMQSNIQAALKNQDNLETLLDTSDTMKKEAGAFNRSTNRAKSRMQWKNLRMTIFIILAVVILGAVILVPVILHKTNTTSTGK